MVQRLLTKYGLIVHIACMCLFPVGVLGQSRTTGLVPLLWLSFMVAEWMFLLPSVKRVESLGDARRRVVRACVWDPFLYVGVALIAWVGVQFLNSGLELVYLSDADVWQLSDPPVSWVPFAVERRAAFAQLALLTACCTAGCALRVAAGKAARRVLLQLLACVSGAIAWVVSGLALQGVDSFSTLATASQAPAAGTFFGFWMVLGIGLYVEQTARDQHAPRLLFVLAGVGNLFGMLFFASPLMVILFSVVAVALLLYGMPYLTPFVSKATQLKLFVNTTVCLAVVAASLGYLFPQNPVAVKLRDAWPLIDHWNALAMRNGVRFDAALSICQQHPWTGVGADGFYHYVAMAVKQSQWGLIDANRSLAYCDGIQFLCEYGVFGAGLMMAAVVALLIPLCYRARLLWNHKGHEPERAFPFRLSPIVLTGCVALSLCCVESFFASPFRAPAVMLSWVCVLAALPAFLPEKGRAG